MLTLLLAFALPAAAPSDADQIRTQRARSNAAIAAHDAKALPPLYVQDPTVIRGSSGGVLRGAEAMDLSFAFSDPDFVTYERTPDTVTISQGGARAAEYGHWTGRWKKPGGDAVLSGVYLAAWVKEGGAWKLRSESFVSLKCDGGAYCAEVM